MRRRTLIRALCMLVLFMAIPWVASAQDAASVVILKLERFDAADEAVAAVQAELERGIEAHADMNVKGGGEMSIKEFALTAGCEEVDDACMKMLRDFIDADRVVFGSVQQSEDVFLFTFKMYDFAESRYVAEITDQTVQGDLSKVRRVLPAIVEGFLYGDVGTLTVNVTGADSPDLMFDGEKVGLAPTTLENLPLGEHVVTLRPAEGEEQTKTVVLRYDQPATLDFTFGSGAVAGGGGGGGVGGEQASGGGSPVPGIVSLGIGAVGIGVGILGVVQFNGVKKDEEAYMDENFRGGGDALVNDDAAAAHPGAVEDFANRGGTARTLQLVGFSVGGAALVTGAILLMTSGGDSESGEASASLPFDFGVAPTKDGVAASFGMRF